MLEFPMGMATRDAYGKALVELGAEMPELVVLDADLSKSTKTAGFGAKYPERFLNVGIAEANMVGIATGLAACGKVPFISSFACFLMCKGLDQLRMGVAYPRANVKVVTSHGGISIGEDGPSQQSIEDFALALSLPGFVVLHPADEVATRDLIRRTAHHQGPVYMRTGRPKVPRIYEAGREFPFGGSATHSLGADVTILCCGLLVAEALQAADSLKAEGLDVGVVDLYCLRPLDEATIVKAAQTSRALVVAEEHMLEGGLGSQVARTLAARRPARCRFVGLETYAESGTPSELVEKYGLTAPSLVSACREALA